MNNFRAYLYGTLAFLVLLAGLVGTAFVMQNMSRTTQLSLDLGLVAMQLGDPLPIPALIGISFAAGLVPTALFFLYRGWGQSSRIRRLEQQLALSDKGSEGSWR